MEQNYQADCIIVGSGLVGAAQALALAQYGISSIIVDKTTPEEVLDNTYDGRVSAISHASSLILQSLGIWDEILSDAGAIDKILVTEGGTYSDVIFDTAETGGEPFGHMVRNLTLRQVLLRAIMKHPNITCVHGETAIAVEQSQSVTVTLSSGAHAIAPLLIVADGRYSNVREMIGIKARRFEYGQHAIVCAIKHDKPHQQTATEWFFPVGPLAILPMHGGHHSCIVWTEEAKMADYLASRPEHIFMEELERKLDGSMGTIALESKIYSYPLNLFQAESYIAPRCAVIGDAAHAIHPIAGQGVNLGYRDVAVLTELLVNAMRNGQDIGNNATLEHYQQWRRFDATSMIVVTDALNRLFSNNSRLVRMVRRTGMALFQRNDMVKFFFIDAAMGMSGDLPKMLRGELL